GGCPRIRPCAHVAGGQGNVLGESLAVDCPGGRDSSHICRGGCPCVRPRPHHISGVVAILRGYCACSSLKRCHTGFWCVLPRYTVRGLGEDLPVCAARW